MSERRRRRLSIKDKVSLLVSIFFFFSEYVATLSLLYAQLTVLIEQLLDRISMADHERLFQKDDAEKCVPGYVILCENQSCRRRSLRTRTQCELTLDALREKSRNTVYTLSELREDVRTMIRKKIDSSDDHSHTRRKSKLLDRIGTLLKKLKLFFLASRRSTQIYPPFRSQ